MITYQPVNMDEISKFIEFDNTYLIDALKKMKVPAQQLPPSLTIDEIKKALDKNDILRWIIINKTIAGYIWLEKKIDCMFISGFAICPAFQGQGILQHALDFAEQETKNAQLSLCRLAVIPLNGRALNAYLKYGYKITQCIERYWPAYPDSFRFIMEKSIFNNEPEEFSDACEIRCSDYPKLKYATDHLYMGIRLIRSENGENADHKIQFVKKLRKNS